MPQERGGASVLRQPRRLGRLEEFAALVTFLASESIASISGRSIAYDDGAPWGASGRRAWVV
ncbi:hypothetical protein [Myxococcus sp. AB036A]|uniref:hypothetical protein n=1 Tax=Myxococcus sp. AB036A TaxID=2562793 RepID=UPI0011476991|nr:hypothetical protein [Myxococcus sp. AB036A]